MNSIVKQTGIQKTTTKRLPVYQVVAAIAVAFLFQGCVVWNFVQVRYENVFGYFNTYYNASSLFNDAMNDIKELKRTQFNPKDGAVPSEDPGIQKKQRIMQYESSVPPSAAEKFNKVIEKCSRILVFYPKSKWVDNALMLIGKSYFHLRESGKAERKFNELLKDYSSSSLGPEAILWLGKTHFQMHQYDVAQADLNLAIEKATAQNESQIVAEAYFTLAEMAIERENHEEAVKWYQKSGEFSKDSDQSIEIQVALAREKEKLGDKKGAVLAYRSIMKMNPSKELMFIAELNYARLSRETGELDQAANGLLDMLDNPQYLDYDSKIQLEIAHLYLAYDDVKSAIDQYTYVDTTFKNQPEVADSYYALAQIYEVRLKNYDKAFDAYTEAKRAFPGLPSAKKAGKRADDFGEYRRVRNMMNEFDTLMFYVLYPDSLAARDSISALNAKIDREKRIAAGEDVDGTSQEKKDMERYTRRRPHGRNSGKYNPVAMKKTSTKTMPGLGVNAQPAPPVTTQPMYRRLNLRALSADSVLQLTSISRLEMGSVMFGKIGNLDSAAYYYQLALSGKLPDMAQAQAYYTLAEIARKNGDEKTAVEYEDLLIKGYAKSHFALSIMQARGMELPKDSTIAAIEAYERAAQLLEQKKYREAVVALKWMIEQYPNSDQAARAKLAIALTYEEELTDGAKAIEIYRQMVKDHPNSKYSQRAKDVLAMLDKKPDADPGKKEDPKAKPETKPVDKPPAKKLIRDEPELKKDTLRGKSADPSQDPDFPLGLPGQNKSAPKQNQPQMKPAQNPQSFPPNNKEFTPIPPPTPQPKGK